LYVICDIETEGLENPQNIWLIVCREVETEKTHVFRNVHEDPSEFLKFAKTVSVWIGHNFIDFDLPVLERLTGVQIDPSRVVDTLVCGRLINQGIEGGHSLEAWGTRLGCPKGTFKDFSKWSNDLELYCLQDTEVTLKVYKKLLPYIKDPLWKNSLRLEHDIAFVCLDMSKNGFAFDLEGAVKIHTEILQRLSVLDTELQEAFPPRSVCLREVHPKATKHGTLSRVDFRWLKDPDLTPFSVDAPFSLIEFVPFNAGSPKQIVERLNEAGWRPYEKTKGHTKTEQALQRCRDKSERTRLEEDLERYRVYGWSVSEGNLNTLPQDAPEAARKLVQRLLLDSRRSTLEEWFKAYQESDKRIHGRFRHIGAWTHRMSHAGPNMANIPAGESAYAHEMRSLWRVPEDRLLVGVDADGIQLRILAHYMNDPAFTQALISGVKEDGTDAHSMNQKALGQICKSRDDAKTFIYAWLLGAGVGKVSQILGCSTQEAREACEQFLSFYPGLKYLKDTQIPMDADRGYFKGLDGRLVKCNNEHLVLAGYLQNGESVVMKKANILWRNKLISERVPFWQVNFVHDEWQTETVNDINIAKYIADTQADSIRQVGELLNLRCPLAGSTLNSHKKLAIGKNWSETH
jgi:DNA polymerase-1